LRGTNPALTFSRRTGEAAKWEIAKMGAQSGKPPRKPQQQNANKSQQKPQQQNQMGSGANRSSSDKMGNPAGRTDRL